MPQIETIDDILNEFADMIGVYGACKSTNDNECNVEGTCCCRVGFMIIYRDRIDQACITEQKLKSAGIL